MSVSKASLLNLPQELKELILGYVFGSFDLVIENTEVCPHHKYQDFNIGLSFQECMASTCVRYSDNHSRLRNSIIYTCKTLSGVAAVSYRGAFSGILRMDQIGSFTTSCKIFDPAVRYAPFSQHVRVIRYRGIPPTDPYGRVIEVFPNLIAFESESVICCGPKQNQIMEDWMHGSNIEARLRHQQAEMNPDDVRKLFKQLSIHLFNPPATQDSVVATPSREQPNFVHYIGIRWESSESRVCAFLYTRSPSDTRVIANYSGPDESYHRKIMTMDLVNSLVGRNKVKFPIIRAFNSTS